MTHPLVALVADAVAPLLPWWGVAGGVLGASLVGSVHCAAMCGGFVCLYAGDTGSAGRAALRRAHAWYNGGRLASYLLLGGVAGALGGAVTQAGQRAGVARAAPLLAGALMVAWAVVALAARRGVALARLPLARLPLARVPAPAAWQRALGGVLRHARAQPVQRRALLTGVLTTLLPCGWLYLFVATAGGSGSMAGGMALMALFWLGTLPAMLAVAAGAQRLLQPLLRRAPAMAPVVVLLLGVAALTGRLAPPAAAWHAHGHHGGPASAAEVPSRPHPHTRTP